MPRPSLASRLRAARKARTLAAHAVDKLAGLRAGHTWSIENGQRDTITAETASKLAHVLGVSLDWLINGEGEGPRASVDKAG